MVVKIVNIEHALSFGGADTKIDGVWVQEVTTN